MDSDKLKEEMNLITKVFDLMNDHVVITDPDAKVLYANKAAYAQTGYDLKEIIGKDPGKLWGGHMTKEFYERMWDTIKVNKKPFIEDIRNQKKDGSAYWQKLIIFPVLDEDDSIKFFVGLEPNIDAKEKVESGSGYHAMERLNSFIMTEQVKFFKLRKLLEELRSGSGNK